VKELVLIRAENARLLQEVTMLLEQLKSLKLDMKVGSFSLLVAMLFLGFADHKLCLLLCPMSPVHVHFLCNLLTSLISEEIKNK
jgi:polyferredoxin